MTHVMVLSPHMLIVVDTEDHQVHHGARLHHHTIDLHWLCCLSRYEWHRRVHPHSLLDALGRVRDVVEIIPMETFSLYH